MYRLKFPYLLPLYFVLVASTFARVFFLGSGACTVHAAHHTDCTQTHSLALVVLRNTSTDGLTASAPLVGAPLQGAISHHMSHVDALLSRGAALQIQSLPRRKYKAKCRQVGMVGKRGRAVADWGRCGVRRRYVTSRGGGPNSKVRRLPFLELPWQKSFGQVLKPKRRQRLQAEGTVSR